MNIAMLSYHTCPLATLGGKDTGGMNVYVRDLTRELGRLGIHVDVFTRSQDEHVPHVLHDLGYGNRVVHIPAGPEVPMPKEELASYLPQFVAGIEKFAGLWFKEADAAIVRDLRERGLLLHTERHRHSYPFCWRCDQPLLQYATRSWFVRTTAAKERLVELYRDHRAGRRRDGLSPVLRLAARRAPGAAQGRRHPGRDPQSRRPPDTGRWIPLRLAR